MTSNFTNISVSDTVLSDTITTNTLNCNYLAISSTEIGASTLKCNNLLPFSGSNISINSNNTNVNGYLTVSSQTALAKANSASQILFTTSGEQTFMDMYSHSNVANIFPDARIFSIGGVANVAGSGTLYIGSRNCNFGPGLFTPTAGIGNLNITYNSSNITGNLYCNRFVNIKGNLECDANLQVDRNANILGNLTVGNVIIGNQLTNNANINCANINANGGIIQNLIVNNSFSTSGNVNAGNVISNANLITLGNLVINSTGNISNALTIRSGFKGATATNKFITYDIPFNGTHYFWDNIESTGDLLVNGGANIVGNSLFGSDVNITGNLFVSTFGNIISLRGSGNSEVGYNALNRKIKMGAIDATTQRISFYCSSNITAENMNGYIEIDSETNGATTQNRGALNMVCGNITMGSINGQSFILYNKNAEIQGNINALQALSVLGNTSVQILKYADLYRDNIRVVDCWGAINAITILNNAYVPFSTPLVGAVDQLSSPWFRVNKQGQSLTIGCQVILSLHTGAAFTNTTTGQFQVETSTTSAFTTFTSRTLVRCLGTFAQDSYNQYIIDFILPTTEQYFRIKYNGNATYTLIGGVANGYLSRYSFRTYV